MTKQVRKLRRCIWCRSTDGACVRFHPVTKLSLGILCRKHSPKTVRRSELGNARMAAGNERKISKVIVDGIVKEWVGIGWIGDEKATAQDERRYPFAVP